MGIPLAGPVLLEKSLPQSASVIDKAIEGFSATIMTVQGFLTLSV